MPCPAAAKMDHLKAHGAGQGKGVNGRQSGRVAGQGNQGDHRTYSFDHCRDKTGDVDYSQTLPWPESH